MSTSARTSVFGGRLRSWREARGVSQRALEAAIEKQRGYVTHLESGKFTPPPREVCDAIARHLQVDPDEVWNVAVDERLMGLDPDLYAVFDATRRGLPDLTGDERRLVEALRRLESVAGGGRPVTPSLLRMVNLVATQHLSPADSAPLSAQGVVSALFALDDCSARTVRRILRLNIEAVEALGEEREHLGFGRE